jgi:hypothetical protein
VVNAQVELELCADAAVAIENALVASLAELAVGGKG